MLPVCNFCLQFVEKNADKSMTFDEFKALFGELLDNILRILHVYVHIHIHTIHMCACIRTYICMYLCAYKCKQIYKYVFAHTCVYAYSHIQ